MSSAGRGKPEWLLARTGVFVAGALFAGACVHDGYPLGPGGSVDIRLDVEGSLFAADKLSADGKASGSRQTPFSTLVKLSITENNAPAFGSYVQVRVEPPEALTISSDKDEGGTGPSCETFENAFRCTATTDGFAQFVATSSSDWSGSATIIVTWANLKATQAITILPAGLPPDTTNVQLFGVDATEHILPTYKALACASDSVPNDLGTKWRPGHIRNRQVTVRATAPADEPGSIANAPVYVESLSDEAAFDTSSKCENRVTRTRVTLGSNGESKPFYVCYSDIGGNISFAVTSGKLILSSNPSTTVEAEPRLLRVATILSTTPISTEPVRLFQIAAYDANFAPIAMPVDLSTNDHILQLQDVSINLNGGNGDPTGDPNADGTGILATPVAEGTTKLHVTPLLLSEPDCSSETVTVTPAVAFP